MNILTNSNQNQLYKDYYKRKRIAIIMEESNNSAIILIPSIPNKDNQNEWLKIGGNSALFYKYLIAPRLNKKPPVLHPDTDLNCRFKNGIIAVHWQDIFIKNMTNLGFKYKIESELLIFNLKHKYSFAEIKKLRQKDTEEKNKTNQLLRPSHTIPDLYGLFLVLAQTLPNKIRKMDEYYRNSFGLTLNHTLTYIFELYIATVNNQIDKETAKQSFLKTINKMHAILIILNENHALDYSTEQRLGTLLQDINNTIEKHFKAQK